MNFSAVFYVEQFKKFTIMNETLEKIAYFLNDLGIEYYYDSSKKMLVLDGKIDSNKCRKLQEFNSNFDNLFTHWGFFQIEISLNN